MIVVTSVRLDSSACCAVAGVVRVVSTNVSEMVLTSNGGCGASLVVVTAAAAVVDAEPDADGESLPPHPVDTNSTSASGTTEQRR